MYQLILLLFLFITLLSAGLSNDSLYIAANSIIVIMCMIGMFIINVIEDAGQKIVSAIEKPKQ